MRGAGANVIESGAIGDLSGNAYAAWRTVGSLTVFRPVCPATDRYEHPRCAGAR